MLYLLLLIAGFAPLIFGANILVDSASALAKKWNIPNIVIGLTIVAFGTSSPELIVNIFASVEKSTDITLGNIVGSNIFNILLIIGLSAMITPLAVKTNTTWIEVPLTLLSALVLITVMNDSIIDGAPSSFLSRTDAIVLLFLFSIFLAYIISISLHGSFEEELVIKPYSVGKAFLFILTGLALLIAGGRLIVFSAVKFATIIGISERIIGLTIVAAGTSLPELATSIIAARKKNIDIAIGNIVGSNIFNVFFVLGISGLINPIPLTKGSNIDMMLNILASLLLFTFIFTRKGRMVDRFEGALFVLIYIGYVSFLIFI